MHPTGDVFYSALINSDITVDSYLPESFSISASLKGGQLRIDSEAIGYVDRVRNYRPVERRSTGFPAFIPFNGCNYFSIN